MRISNVLDRRDGADRGNWTAFCWMRNSPVRALGLLLLANVICVAARAQSGPLVLERNGRTIAIEPYASNIFRITMSIDRASATIEGLVAAMTSESALGESIK